jgi:hypothetical protein
MYSLQETPYLRPLDEFQTLKDQIKELDKRLNKVERKKRA